MNNTAQVLQANGIGSGSILDGFTITAGLAPVGQDGGAINLSNAASPLIRNCVFSGNRAAVYTEGASILTLSQCSFIGNSKRGGSITITGSTADISACNFSKGTLGTAVRVFNSSALVTLTQCHFTDNAASTSGSGALDFESAEVIVTDCTFIGNATSDLAGGAVLTVESTATLNNCLFLGNKSAQYGGAILASNSGTTTLNHCTLSGNLAETETGGAILAANLHTLNINNCVIWNNQDSTGTDTASSSVIDASGDSFITTRNSIIANSGGSATWDAALGTDGGGNLDVDPLFVTSADPATAPNSIGDLRLLIGSPAIDAGDNALIPAGITTDLLGNARIQGSTVDMGAYEGGIALYGLWAESHGLTGADALSSADPENDGLNNLMEYAFGLDPMVSSTGALTLTGVSGLELGSLGLPIVYLASTESGVDFRAVFTRRIDYLAAGLTYTVQFSNDLITWEDSSIIPTTLDTDGTMNLVSVSYPPFLTSGERAQFFRVQISLVSP